MLEPTPPFPKTEHRSRLAALVLPVMLGSFFLSPYMLTKSISFGAGFGFFGDPIITRGLDFLNRKIPNWMELLDLRK